MDKSEILSSVRQYVQEHHAAAAFAPGSRIPYAGRIYDEEEVCNLVDAALEFWLTAGRYSAQFEREFAAFLSVKYASLVNSGSSANLLAFAALTAPELGERAIRPGDEVITVAAAFPTTVTPVLQYGAVPLLVDIAIPQYNIDVTRLEEARSEKTKAVVLAHTLGNPFDIAAVKSFCDRYGLWLVEDNCDALGSACTLDGKTYFTGTIGDIGTSSFYPPHHITMGEGGCVYTNHPLLHRLVNSYRDWGRDCMCAPGQDGLCGRRFDGQHGELPAGYDHKYVYSHFGYNLKATDLQAAIGCAQLKKLPSFIRRRRENWTHLRDMLCCAEDRLILPEPAPDSQPSWFGFLITLKDGMDRREIVTRLEAGGVQTRMLFSGNLLRHPCFTPLRESGKGYRVVGTLEQTDRVMRDAFWVGVYPGLTDETVDYMGKCILKAVGLG